MKNANKVLFAFLTILITVFFINVNDTSADEMFSMSSFSCGEPLISEDLHKDIDKFKEEDANMVESFIATQSQHFLKLGDVNSLGVLVFGNPYCSWVDDKDVKMASNGVFTDSEMKKIINPLMDIFKGIAISMIVLSILISAIKLMTSPARASAMDDFFNSWKMILVVIILYVSYDLLINLLFQMNSAIVISIRDLIPDNEVRGISIAAKFSDYSLLLGFVPMMILVMVEWVLAVILNFIYISRKIIILILMVIGFVAIYSLLFHKTRGFFLTWFKELCGNIFLQSIHAIVLYSIVMFSAAGAGSFFKICLLVMFIPVSGLLSKLLQFGDSATKSGMAMSMLGLGGIASTYMVASQAGNVLRGGGMMNSSSSTMNADGSVGGSSLSELATNSGSDLMQTAISSTATGTNSPMFSAIKGGMSTGGAIAGSIAGMAAGPMGVAVGAGAGKAIAGAIPQMGMNLGTGITGLSNTISQAKQFAAQSGVGLGALLTGKAGSNFAVASQGRHFAGAIGESVGLMLGGQKGAAIGRNLGANIAGDTNKLAAMNSAGLGLVDANGNTIPMSFDALGKLNPGAEMKFVQTNEGSAMYMNGAEGWQQVGLTGAADTSLANGQARVMDFNLADSSKDYQLQPNGSYTATAAMNDPTATSSSSLSEALGSSVITSGEAVEPSKLSQSMPTVATSVEGGLVASIGEVTSPISTVGLNGSEGTSSASIDSTGIQNLDTSTIDSGTTGVPIEQLGNSVFSSSDAPIEAVNNLSEMPTSIEQSVPGIESIPGTSDVSPISEAPSQESSGGFERPELAGLPGSTDGLMRTNDAQIVNTGGVSFHDTINEVTKDGVVGFKDATFDPKKFNPETYVYRGPQSTSMNVSELNNVPKSKVASSWIKQAHRVSATRHKGVQ